MTGIFDSGIGGLFILKALIKQIPYSSVMYLADTRYFPYGSRSASQIRTLVKRNVEYLISKGADNVIIACNTASTVLEEGQYPVPVWGVIESALQQAKKLSGNGQVVVLATQLTVQSEIYIHKNKKLQTHLHVHQQACPLLAPYVEEGHWTRNTEELRFLLKKYLEPFLRKGVDTVILGCTHYLYLKEFIQEYIGPDRRVVDPTSFLVNFLKRKKQFFKKDLQFQKSIPLFVSGNIDSFSKKVKMFETMNFHIQKM